MREQTKDLQNEEELTEIEDSAEDDAEDEDDTLEEETVYESRSSVTPARRTRDFALYSIVVLAIIAFTYLLVTMLMQHPRVYDDGTLFIHKTIVTGALGFAMMHLL